MFRSLLVCLLAFMPSLCLAGGADQKLILHQTDHTLAYFALGVFIFAYILVICEEFIHLRKSKPVILASGIIWIFVAMLAYQKGVPDVANAAIKHNILEYGELFLFLLVAMTYVNAMEERQVFAALRGWLVGMGLSFRQLFWITGLLAFVISPIADNLTTALLMCAVVMSVGKEYKAFVGIACVNIVIAANAGGAFSPFGDITTLMVWQKGIVPFQDFFQILVPSIVNWIIPASIMQFAVQNERPKPIDAHVKMYFGAKRVMGLFLLTILTAVCFHNFFHLPPAVGMMTGLSYLQFFGYYLKMTHHDHASEAIAAENNTGKVAPFDIFKKVERAEWDTLLFFYGVILCVGGLATLGYLEVVSSTMYENWGASMSAVHKQTPANFAVGILSALVDNIPVMFAVLTMNPTMSEGQWLLVTLTAGTGGSLLSVGSAAGVALMGQARGYYTFFGHLKWAWAIFLGYVASIGCHIWLNSDLFTEVGVYHKVAQAAY